MATRQTEEKITALYERLSVTMTLRATRTPF